jgi:hypothetical protein
VRRYLRRVLRRGGADRERTQQKQEACLHALLIIAETPPATRSPALRQDRCDLIN